MTQKHIQVLSPHRFKPIEWLVSKQLLISCLKKYWNEFDRPGEWTDSAIWHFLELYNWLYGEEKPQQHHFRCVLTLIREGEI